MGNDHLSRRSSPTASTSFHPAGLGKSMGHETHTKNHEKTTWLGTRFSVSPEGLVGRGQGVRRKSEKVEEWKGVRGVDSRRLEAREVDAKGQTCRVTFNL